MSAVEALQAATRAGVKVALDGDDLVLEASAPPPSAILDQLSHHKAGVMALLRSRLDVWSGHDWRAHFDERAAIAEHDGGLPRPEAERLAFETCVVEWLKSIDFKVGNGTGEMVFDLPGTSYDRSSLGITVQGRTWVYYCLHAMVNSH